MDAIKVIAQAGRNFVLIFVRSRTDTVKTAKALRWPSFARLCLYYCMVQQVRQFEGDLHVCIRHYIGCDEEAANTDFTKWATRRKPGIL